MWSGAQPYLRDVERRRDSILGAWSEMLNRLAGRGLLGPGELVPAFPPVRVVVDDRRTTSWTSALPPIPLPHFVPPRSVQRAR